MGRKEKEIGRRMGIEDKGGSKKNKNIGIAWRLKTGFAMAIKLKRQALTR